MKSSEKQESIKVTHIFHSGVILETEKNLLIIDYYNEKDGLDQQVFFDYLKEQNHKDFYYLVTHGHADHFTEEIFTSPYQSAKGITRYVLSEDLRSYKKAHPGIKLCRPYQEFSVGDIQVTTFGSTDQGVSYLIYIKSRNTLVFHSGDLNWWHWKNFSQDEQLQEKKDFLEEIQKLKAHLNTNNATPDIAFIPVDPRLEEFYNLTGNAFLEEIKPKKMFPLHFRDHYNVTKKFKEQSSDPDRVESVSHSMETFVIQV